MNLKRILGFVLIFFILILIYQFVIVFFENSHTLTYKLSSDNTEFTIVEEYDKDKNDDRYFLDITADGKEFVYYLKNDFNKQKRIVKDIKTYKKDNYLCIYPLTINSDVELEILCHDGDELLSYHYTNEKKGISLFSKELNLENEFLDDKSEEVEENGVKLYTNNYYENEYLFLYRYKYVTLFNNGEISTESFSQSDVYKNELGVFINNYFVVPVMNAKKEIDHYRIIDCKSRDYKMLNTSDTISSNIYNLGILDGKLYAFDLNKKIEYAIDPENSSYEKIGSVDMGFKIYKNGNWEDISITEFTNNHIMIDNTVNDKDLEFSYDSIYDVGNAYYLLKNNKIYKVYKDKKDLRILLLELDHYNNLIIDSDRVYYIVDDCLYRYDKYGIKTLVNNNEFKYNNTNIYGIYSD